MLIDVMELPETKRIVQAAEAQIFANTGIQIKLTTNNGKLEYDAAFKKMQLINIICSTYNTTWKAVVSKSRQRAPTLARNAFMYFMRKSFGETFTKIAVQVNRDHTSVIHAVKTIENFYKVGDPSIERINTIKEKYNANL